MNSSDSAEEIVKLSLEGMEVAVKIAGAGAKNIAVMLYTILKDKEQTSGKIRLTNMLKTGKPLKIFTIRAEDLKKFSQEAKKYGVLYCVLADKKNSKIDGMVDIMVREDDASKINRISERFKFARVDTGTIERELEREKQNIKATQNNKSEDEQFIDDILSKPVEQEISKEKISPSKNTEELTEKSQLESFSETKAIDKIQVGSEMKKSVREELKVAEKEVREREIQKSKEKNFNRKDDKSYEKSFKKEKRFNKSKYYDNTKNNRKNKGRSK